MFLNFQMAKVQESLVVVRPRLTGEGVLDAVCYGKGLPAVVNDSDC